MHFGMSFTRPVVQYIFTGLILTSVFLLLILLQNGKFAPTLYCEFLQHYFQDQTPEQLDLTPYLSLL